ncbi:MAG TPA: CheR family methyltransferase [Tepidisphaeraceae bacterium]|nr:CheR family methyltransferase [Tepidisphaeraceae bacterium]
MLSGHLFFEPIDDPPARVSSSRRARMARCEAFWKQHEPVVLDPLLETLIARAGLDVRAYRDRALQRRLHSCLRAIGESSSTHAIAALDRRPELFERAVDSVLLGVTAFFRDNAVFRLLAERCIPALQSRHRAERRGLRVWSAGCSEGHELYSVALLMEEAGCLAGAELLGTDCRAGAIRSAERGRFDASALQCIPPALRETAFTIEHGRLCVRPGLRKQLRWRRSDLLRTVEPGPWDMVLCRNVTIYLKPDAAERVWSALSRVVRNEGYLVVGKADHPSPELGFRRLASCVYQKIEGAS